jgi:succinate dehydrogenase / fumarate reductase, cytochrome b subunit
VGILGTVLLIFIVLHMRTFWFEMHFGYVPTAEYDGQSYKDLYKIVTEAFSQWWYVLIYVLSMGALGYHLAHGFQSGFQTFGLRHKKYTPLIQFLGTWVFAIIIPALFAAMPVYFYLKHVGVID